ncbi:MAG: hypothetical protein II970_05035 [Paludibacteraceae bacterium]|nr:hypothetical protein [Paludibacteraceae bacterium]
MRRRSNNTGGQTTGKENYWRFLFRRGQLYDWLAVLLSCVCGYVLIRVCYPYPGTYSDSFSYIAAAESDTFSIYRPFGYSAFLQAVHVLSGSWQAVIAAQFMLYAVATGLFVLALKKYYPIKRTWLRVLLEAGITLSPVAVYMLNSLMSDALFCCLIFIMLAMLLVVINEQSWAAAGVYSAAFFACLFVRYSAMFFPIAFVPVLLFTEKKALRWTTIVVTGVLFGIFYSNISGNMEKVVHKRQFSTGFDGWQLANNGMHVLPFIEEEMAKPVPEDKRVRELHEFSRIRFNEQILQKTDSGRKVTAAFLWQRDLPLKQYTFYTMEKTRSPYPVTWARLGGGVFADYGKWLILHYPAEFWKHYLAPNICSAFRPWNLEMVGHYGEIPQNQPDMASYYDMDTSQPHPARYELYEKNLRGVLPASELVTWLLFAAAAAVIVVRRKTLLADRRHVLSFVLLFVFGFIFYGTTVFAAPIVIRYWMPMHALKAAFVWMAARKA